MYLQYGSYQHAVNEATVSIDRQALLNDAGQPYAVQHTWAITGCIHGTDTADVVAKYTALELAYSFWFRDIGLFTDDGSMVHGLANAGSLTGVRVTKRPSYPVGDGAELSTFRNYAIVVTADYPDGGVNPMKSFREELRFSGGGPRQEALECVNAPPDVQVLTAFTAFRAVQSGRAVGMFGYPPIPPPLWPLSLAVAGSPTFGSPVLKNGIYVDFPVSWDYQFVSAVPLTGYPNRWPTGG